jgi:murein DD-endopeptidase MepM/ murein hydrolase activator NlpD
MKSVRIFLILGTVLGIFSFLSGKNGFKFPWVNIAFVSLHDAQENHSLGQFIWPITGKLGAIENSYGAKKWGFFQIEFGFHAGIDISCEEGTAIVASSVGKIISIIYHGGYGNLIEIAHSDGYITKYAHLSKIAEGIMVGKTVYMGKVIGYSGKSGFATHTHLHFEILKNGESVDPMILMNIDKSGISNRYTIIYKE